MSNCARVLLIVPLALVSLAAGERDAALIQAARTQDHQMVAALVEGGADVDVHQGDGATALHWAAYWDDQVMADLLITAKADVNASNALGATALWLASRNRNPAMIATLLDAGANPNATLSTGETPLMQASLVGDVASVRALLAHSADVNAHETSRDQTALMWAVSNGHTEVVRALLEAGADVHARSHASQRMVSTAARVGVVGGTVYDRDGVFEVGAGGYTALLLAARQGQLESARLLVAAGANVNDASTYGTSALVVAAHSGHTGLGAHAAVGTLLLEHGADPDAAGAGYTALHAAVLTGDRETGQGAARAWRGREPAAAEGHAGASFQHGFRARQEPDRRHTAVAGREVCRKRHHARPPGPRRGAAVRDDGWQDAVDDRHLGWGRPGPSRPYVHQA